MFHPRGPGFFELARQALSSTERGYDLLARKFDYTPFRTPDVVLRKAGEVIAASGPIDAALDICCGTGAAMEMLRPLCRRVAGIDISEGMLQVARGCVPQAEGSAELEFVRGNVLDMPFAAEFDAAVCFGAHGHILPEDEARFVAQTAKVLKPGGRFWFVTTYLPPKSSLDYWLARGFNAAMHARNRLVKPPFVMFYLTFLLPEVRELLERHGFEVKIHEGVFQGRLQPLKLVCATKREE
jgi:ubiquinone/menaquinone biosynthesis C-methylase UbiE